MPITVFDAEGIPGHRRELNERLSSPVANRFPSGRAAQQRPGQDEGRGAARPLLRMAAGVVPPPRLRVGRPPAPWIQYLTENRLLAADVRWNVLERVGNPAARGVD